MVSLADAAAGAGVVVMDFPGHDPVVFDRYPSAPQECGGSVVTIA
ncbi:MAG: hypothetical protein ACRDPT_13515 [Streptomycetales bacterium]